MAKIQCAMSKGAPAVSDMEEEVALACAQICQVKIEVLEDIYPASQIQKRHMAAHLAYGAYMLQTVYEFKGKKETIPLVQKAFNVVRGKNDILRTRMVQYKSEVLQVVLKDIVPWYEGNELAEYKAQDMKTPMGYGAPLVRYATIVEGDHIFFVETMHHCVCDGFSKVLFLDDLQAYLTDPEAFDENFQRPRYKMFIEFLKSSHTEEASLFWNSHLKDFQPPKPIISIRADQRPLANRLLVKAVPFNRPAKGAPRMSSMAYAAFALVLGTLTDSNDIVIMSARAGRKTSVPGMESIMGPVATVVPLRVKLRREDTISMLLRSIQNDSMSMFPYEQSGPMAMSQVGHLNTVHFNWHPLGSDFYSKLVVFDHDGSRVQLMGNQNLSTPFKTIVNMLFDVWDVGDHLRLEVVWNDKIADESLAHSVRDQFAKNLLEICSSQTMSVGSLLLPTTTQSN